MRQNINKKWRIFFFELQFTHFSAMDELDMKGLRVLFMSENAIENIYFIKKFESLWIIQKTAYFIQIVYCRVYLKFILSAYKTVLLSELFYDFSFQDKHQ